jgi:hypothetical protein
MLRRRRHPGGRHRHGDERWRATRDQWVKVTGTFGPGGAEIPRIAATSVVEIAAPNDPYD